MKFLYAYTCSYKYKTPTNTNYYKSTNLYLNAKSIFVYL